MSLKLVCSEKSRADYAEETISDRQAIAASVTQLVAAELLKSKIPLSRMSPGHKAEIIAHATQVAFTIASAITKEDIRRFGHRIDHE